MTTITNPPSNAVIIDWQLRMLLTELLLLQQHASDPNCPCRLTDTGEWCIPKHLLTIAGLAAENMAMDPTNVDMWADLQAEASEQHMASRGILCGKPLAVDLVEWSRGWRKRVEPLYFACNKVFALGQSKPRSLEDRVRCGDNCALDLICTIEGTLSEVGEAQAREEVDQGIVHTQSGSPVTPDEYREVRDLIGRHPITKDESSTYSDEASCWRKWASRLKALDTNGSTVKGDVRIEDPILDIVRSQICPKGFCQSTPTPC